MLGAARVLRWTGQYSQRTPRFRPLAPEPDVHFVQPASGVTWIGFWSNIHRYPSQQREFRGADGANRDAWDGDEGWSSFLDQIIRPVIDNDLRQEGYNACPACAQIDIMKAIPPNVTVYVPGAAATVPLTK
ncbi:hypothetical protein [Amycolatopsis sp. CA-230715]|uniref:hypothetical protein n=1 Tax=Amycolatopsis sp. CA-230715 TaxID=2745196 RepID=UPI001C020779|nr:hypothetical protein [Amycolatopsis sp. CA-230715]QWF84019.1 hypothetical protein HUW46_07463 [Amycolatopsis sp. CA-230715]